MIVYPKSEPFGFTIEQEACELMAALLKRKVPIQEAEERATHFQKLRNAEVVSPRKGGKAHAL